MNAALVLLPDFGLILLGAALRRVLHLGDHFWNGLEKLIYFVLFPALLFSGLVRTRIDWAMAMPLILVVAAAMASGMLLGAIARGFGISSVSFASQYQCAFRFNSYIGLAVAGSLHGTAGIAAMAIAIGVMVPPANVMAVWMLARHGESNVVAELAKNPLILATLVGIAANVGGLALPEVALKFLGRLSEASIALGLLAVGAGLGVGVGRKESSAAHAPKVSPGGTAQGATAAYLLAVKLLAMPAVAWLLARAAGLDPLYADIALIFAGLPTASSAYILAQRMGGDGRRVAWLISVSTLLGMLTLPLWLSLPK